MGERSRTARRHLLPLALCCLLVVEARAAERALQGAEINDFLKGNTVTGHSDKGDWKQYFDAGGDTAYVRGSEPLSRGGWEVRGSKFCSQWPPNPSWTCYTVTGDPAADPRTITWIGDSGARYPGFVHPGNGM